MSLPDRPRLRTTVSLLPFQTPGGREMLAVQDDERLGTVQVAVPRPLGELLVFLLDGTRDAEELRSGWKLVTGAPVERLEKILEQLEDSLLLEGPRVEAARRDALTAYRAQPLRPAAFAGASYGADGARVASDLRAWRESADVDPVPAPVRAVLAPHIDPRGGAATHGAAAAALAVCPAEVFVVLGTAHTALSRPFALTTLDFDTPAGPLSTDREIVGRLATRGGGGLLDPERAHATEHSVEFQAAWLRALHAERPGLRIVPVLVGSQHAHLEAGRSLRDDPAVSDFVAALRELQTEYGDKLALVASVDLAHVGPMYGDPEPTTDERREEVLAADRQLLEHALAVDADGWFEFLRAEKNQRNVCGAAPTWVLLAALESTGVRGRLLRHDDWEIDASTGSRVSFATVAYVPDEGAR